MVNHSVMLITPVTLIGFDGNDRKISAYYFFFKLDDGYQYWVTLITSRNIGFVDCFNSSV